MKEEQMSKERNITPVQAIILHYEDLILKLSDDYPAKQTYKNVVYYLKTFVLPEEQQFMSDIWDASGEWAGGYPQDKGAPDKTTFLSQYTNDK